MMEIFELFENEKLFNGRHISWDKNSYSKQYPNNLAIFNANVWIKEKDDIKIIWYGDLDLTLDSQKLKNIAKELNKLIFVTYEFDGRVITDKDLIKQRIVYDVEEDRLN